MIEWLAQLDINSLVVGALLGLLVGVIVAIIASRSAGKNAQLAERAEVERWQAQYQQLETRLQQSQASLGDTQRQLAVVVTRLEEQQQHFKIEKASLEEAEKRLTESFERLAGRVFDERSKRFNEISEKQLSGLLQPLAKDLDSFRETVEKNSREDIRQHAALKEKLLQMEKLNERLHVEAQSLTKALTRDVKTQGNWGEQQLERLLELSGLTKGEHYSTQVNVSGKNGERLQPDFVLMLPEGRSIILDSKVSLTDWTRLQAADDEDTRSRLLVGHVNSIKAHITSLGKKNYPDADELNALDFVLMFVPIESALIGALQHDSTLPEFALKNRVALLSPANFLATVRTVASVWQIHKQNTNAQDIAQRAGLLYDKFVGFTDNLKNVGARLNQAQQSFDKAYKQLSGGPGNLVNQTQMLSKLGARHNKQLEAGLVELAAGDEDADATTVAIENAVADGNGDEDAVANEDTIADTSDTVISPESAPS